MNPAFEIIAKKYGMDLSLSCSGVSYYSHVTQMAYEMFQARQPEIDRLKQEVCDLSFAARAFQSVLDREKKPCTILRESHGSMV